MHSNWEEMIPFYIAGTLSKQDAARLEDHLSTCDECRKSLEEWRSIATAVRNEAAGQMRDLPPLSAQVLSVARQRAAGRVSSPGLAPFPSRPTTRYRTTSVTLVAAVFTVILFGGLLAFMILRGTTPKQGVVVLLPTATPSTTLSEPATPSILAPSPSEITLIAPTEVTVIPPTAQSPQIIVVEPSVTPSRSLIFNTPIIPTLSPPTAIPPNVIRPTQVIPTAILQPSDTPQPLAQSMVLGMGGGGDSCILHAAVPNSEVNLYAGPGTSYSVVKTFSDDDQLLALSRSDNGWYQAQYQPDNNQWVGWVRQELVYTSGNCDTLPVIAAAAYQTDVTPSATVSASAPMVDPPAVTISSDGINLRSGPGTNYPIVGSARLGESYHIEAQSSNSNQLWYLITVPGARSAWVFGTLVQVSPANAIIAPAMTIPPSPIPTATATPSPTATPSVNIAAGRWSQTITVLSTTCAGEITGTSTTTPVTLNVGDGSIMLAFADAGTSVILTRSGDGVYGGGYSTANNSVSVTLSFTSSTAYTGTVISTQNDGCSTQSAWNGLFQSS